MPQRPEPKWLEALSRFPREKIAYTLMGAAGVLGVAAVAVVIAFGRNGAVTMAGLVFFALALAGIGLWRLTSEPETMVDRDATRILILLVGGFLGLTLAWAAIAQIIQWRDLFLSGAEAFQGPNAKWVWLCVVVELIGLAVMFVSLQLARTEERSNAVLRRLLYGYNAVLTGILLLAFLAVLNVLGYLYLPKAWDWTAAGLHSLSPRSQNILEGLDKPVKVYVLESSRADQLALDVQTLMDNCQRYTNKLQVETLYRDQNPERIGELYRQYQLTSAEGLLVLYGTPPQQSHEFIKRDQLEELTPRGFGQDQRYQFKGEDAFMTTLTYLEEGKTKAVVYFTQGNGELEINDRTGRDLDQGAGVLSDRLQKGNYEVKGLRLSSVGGGREGADKVVTAKQVPEDAAVVVVAAPRRRFDADAIKALREYLKPADPKKKKGKLVVLLDVVTGLDHKMVSTGLEELLAEFNVRVGNDELMMPTSNPLRVQVTPNPRLRDRNPVASAFAGYAFPMYKVRTVRPMAESAPGRAPFQADVLLMTVGPVWAEESLPPDPQQFVIDLAQNHPDDLRAKISDENLPVAVVVSEPGDSQQPFNPHTRRPPPTSDKPRLVVMGDASFIANRNMGEGNPIGYQLFAGCLEWLRERPSNIGIEPKQRSTYQLNEGTNVARMIWLPLGLITFAVVGLGLGVWVVRRR
jgi:hypothetical protein